MAHNKLYVQACDQFVSFTVDFIICIYISICIVYHGAVFIRDFIPTYKLYICLYLIYLVQFR